MGELLNFYSKSFKIYLTLLSLAVIILLGPPRQAVQAQAPDVPPEIRAGLLDNGSARVVVVLRPPESGGRVASATVQISQTQENLLNALPADGFSMIHRFETVPGLAGEVTAAGLETLLSRPEVVAIALDLPVAIACGGDALPKLAAPAWQSLGFTGAGVNVAVLDTGIDVAHVDLTGQVKGQHCFDREGNCPPGESSESDQAQDENGHGTHVAGIIASQGQTSPPGLAPEAGLVAVRVLGRDGTGFTSDVVAGIDWVVANQANLGVKVMNLSLGGGRYAGVCDEADANTMLYAAAVDSARQATITVFAAAGNQGYATELMAPACVSGALSVGNVYGAEFGSFSWPTCVDSGVGIDQVACSSNSSPALELLAPGVRIASTALGGGQGIQSGSSMSTAYASGTAALMLEAAPDLAPDEVATVLRETGVPVTDTRNGQITPRIDPLAALDRLANVDPVTIAGTVLLQGRADHSGTELLLSQSACGADLSGPVLAVTNADGAFEIELPAGHAYRCLQASQPGYLAGQAVLPDTDLETTTLPAGDVTADQMINIFDLAFLGSRYGQNHPLADINADGIVDIFDLALVATNYRRTGPVTLGLDAELQARLSQAGITPLQPVSPPDPTEVALGRMLYFDKELSGNRDIACSTCHLPSRRTGDGLSLSIGTGGVGLGPARQLGAGGAFIPRHAPDIFNRGAAAWRTMFWDSRLSGTAESGFSSPGGNQLPEHLDNVLAAQAMFPVISREEMRGRPGDEDIFGTPNELALLDDADFIGIWDSLMVRLLNITEYVLLLNAAYPGIPTDELGFEYAAKAIAAFEIDAFTLQASPWDRYLGGNELALTDPAKRGALLFYGQAGCSRCHSGNLFTDQQHHNIAVPQLGPGKGDEAPQDFGRFRETGDPADLYAFRTPPLRNVALTGPWLHNGAYTSLKAVIRHHLDPEIGLRSYNPGQLRPELADTFQNDAETVTAILDNLDPSVRTPVLLSDQEMGQLLAFLDALTDPAAKNLSQVVPATVPSGLSIDR